MSRTQNFGQALEELGDDLEKESFWSRLGAFIERTEIRLTSADAKLDYASPGKEVIGGLKAGLNIKAELKTGSTFRRSLSKFLSSYLVELENDVAAFIEDGIKLIQQRRGKDVQVVFIFDQLEQLRGDYRNW